MDKKDAIYLLDCLIKGFNPFNGEEIGDDSIINNAKFIRAFYELKHFIEESVAEEKIRKEPFSFKTREGIVKGPMNITAFIDKINEVNLTDNMKKFTRTSVMDWLYDNNYLVLMDDKKQITEKGKEAGICYDHRVSMYGKEYEIILYPEKLLNHILDLIESGEIA